MDKMSNHYTRITGVVEEGAATRSMKTQYWRVSHLCNTMAELLTQQTHQVTTNLIILGTKTVF